MKQTDPCGFCHRTLRPGDSFHEVILTREDKAGRPAGRYGNVCGECAGFEYSPPAPPPPGEARKQQPQRCGLCKRVMVKHTPYEKLRFTAEDDVPFEPGLHAMCIACYDEYVQIVQRRVADKAGSLCATGAWLM